MVMFSGRAAARPAPGSLVADPQHPKHEVKTRTRKSLQLYYSLFLLGTISSFVLAAGVLDEQTDGNTALGLAEALHTFLGTTCAPASEKSRVGEPSVSLEDSEGGRSLKRPHHSKKADWLKGYR